MQIRYLKIVLVLIISAAGLLNAVQNITNLDEAYGVIAYVLGMTDQTYYPNSVGPAFTSPSVVWAALTVIVASEFFLGLLAARGAWDMWGVRGAPATEFNGAKKHALLGCGLGVIVWFGYFIVGGGGYFQMWQTEVGANSLAGALQLGAACGIIFLMVNATDE